MRSRDSTPASRLLSAGDIAGHSDSEQADALVGPALHVLAVAPYSGFAPTFQAASRPFRHQHLACIQEPRPAQVDS